ncbi:MAG: hypothetical protein GXY76_14915 [Chloroflexi bacterium]|nr:hypothetical protein [Chloroflexota bacterium]
MQMLYKPDWEQARARMLAWWAGAESDRPIIQVTAPRREAPGRPGWSSWSLIHNLDHPERALEGYEAYCRDTFFGGEAFPNLWINLGPGVTAAYLGRVPRIAEETVWFEAAEAMSWERILSLRLDPDDKWWAITKRLTSLATERGHGQYFASVTDLNGVHNVLGSLRGTQRLAMDCLDDPDLVKRASAHLTDIWLQCYDELVGITQRRQEGSSSWMGIWFPGRGSDVQSDFAAMLSPRMFADLILPDLRRQCQHVEQSIFHWDGPGQIRHLDALLDIPELGGLQWVPGAGNPTTGSPQWFPLYQRIQARGKRLVLQGMEPGDVRGVVETCDPRGLLITTSCATEQEARDLLAMVPQWARARR